MLRQRNSRKTHLTGQQIKQKGKFTHSLPNINSFKVAKKAISQNINKDDSGSNAMLVYWNAANVKTQLY